MGKDMITIEFYKNSVLPESMIGAVDVEVGAPDGRKSMESAKALGRVICRIWRLDVVDAVILDRNGVQVDVIPVHR